LRNEDDADGNPFLGFDRRVIAFQEITEAEQADNSTDNRVLAPDAVLNANIGEQINALHLPNLAGIDGNLPGSRISGNIDVSNLPLNIPANNVPNLQGLNGDLPLSRTTGELGPGRVPGLGRLHGKVKAHSQIDWGSGAPPVPAGKVAKGYHYDKLEGRPNLKKFLTRSDFRADGTLKR
jgi:hypothetical protein